MSGRGEADLIELTVALGGEMLRLGGAAQSYEHGRERIAASLKDGSALDRFRRCVALQHGKLPEDFAAARAPEGGALRAERDGVVNAIDAQAVGMCGIALGGGRAKKEDPVDPSQWIHVTKKCGEVVKAGDVLCRFSRPADAHVARVGQSAEAIVEEVSRRLRVAYTVGDRAVASSPLVLEVIR
jgi:pyrimidine-nucleoside phosphorylase